MLRPVKIVIARLLKLFFAPGRYFKRRKEFIFSPVFDSFDDMIDQVYRLTWYLPTREGVSIRMCYHDFKFSEQDLLDDSNRPGYMHTLPINLKNIQFLKTKNLWVSEISTLLSTVLGSQIILWEEPQKGSYFFRIIELTGNFIIVDHKNCSYSSDINYVGLIHGCLEPRELDENFDLSRSIFSKKNKPLRSKYNKVYIFGRGPSLSAAFNLDFSDGVRIICNQTVSNQKLMKRINPHIIIAGDHCWNMGCSKLSDYFRKDAINCVMHTEAILVLPLDCYPLMINHYPELKGKMVGIPYFGNDHNFNLIDNFYTKSSNGVLFEFLFPIACTISNEIKMLGFDGNPRPDIKFPDFKVPYSHYKLAEYPDDIVDSIHASRPGYYDRDLSDFREQYDVLFKTMIDEAEAKGFKIETLAPSHHTALKDKFRGDTL